MTEDELLARIYDAPDDDGPRLVYADWLMSNDDPRGELIALQCRTAETDDRKTKVAENKLIKQHGAAWTARLPKCVSKSIFRRGFVDEIDVDLHAVGEGDARAIFEGAPLLRRLRVDTHAVVSTNGTVERISLEPLLTHREGLANLESLDVRAYALGERGARAIAECTHFARLRSLSYRHANTFVFHNGGPRLGGATLALLARSPHLATVTSLDLSEDALQPDDLAPVLEGRWSLASLELGNNGVGADGARAIASSNAVAKLKHLGLAGAQLDQATLSEIAKSTSLASLESLDLERCHAGVFVALLFSKNALPSLRALRVERNRLTDAGAELIAENERASRLRSLEMGHNLIGKKGAAALASSPHLANLERITLNEPRWKDETIDLFRKSTTLAKCQIYVRGRLLARA